MSDENKNDECLETSGLSNNQPENKLESVLQKATHEQLCTIIKNKAERDESFCSDVIMRLGTPDLKDTLCETKKRVRLVIRQNTKRGFIGCRGCDTICEELLDSLDVAKSVYLDKYPHIAFEVILFLLISGAKLASTADSSSGSLSIVIDESIKLLEETCQKILSSENSKLQKLCYDKLCKEAANKAFNGWIEWSYEVLKIAALFVTEKNRKKLEEALEDLRYHIEQESFLYDSAKASEAKVRLRMIEIVEGKLAARVFIDKNLDIDEMRQQAIQQDMVVGAYQNAEYLCLERIHKSKELAYGSLEKWLHLLYEIYEVSGETQKQINIADKLAFRGETRYYDKMKALYGEDWKHIYPAIRERYKKSPVYMFVLNAEHEWLLLLNEVRQNPYSVFQYGKVLASYAPDAVYDVYRLEITRAAADATDRRAYKKVCASVRQLSEAVGKEKAQEVIDYLRETYKRRPSMLDELSALERSLKK